MLQWLAPELGRGGLLRNEDWVVEHTDEAAGMFEPKPLAIAATIMAAMDRHAIDYLRQAPVLAVMAAAGSTCSDVRTREYVATVWLKYIKETPRPRLRDLLKAYGPVQQLRALDGRAFLGGQSELLTVKSLCDIAPSRLAQSIPASIRKQRNWLQALSEWRSLMARRNCFAAQPLFEWAAFALSRDIHLDHLYTSIGTVVDFAIAETDFASPTPGFNVTWTYQRALDEALAWHEMVAKQSQEEAFLRTHKIGWDESVNYGRLPDAIEIDGFSIVALRTGAALFAEGSVMRHCVASYSRDVVRGNCFIYSVRVGERRVATLEMSRRISAISSPMQLDTLCLEQLKGPCNAMVSAAVLEAVSAFINECNGIGRRAA